MRFEFGMTLLVALGPTVSFAQSTKDGARSATPPTAASPAPPPTTTSRASAPTAAPPERPPTAASPAPPSTTPARVSAPTAASPERPPTAASPAPAPAVAPPAASPASENVNAGSERSSEPNLAPKAALADEVEVVTKDGAVYRGVLIEKAPGRSVTLRLSTGEHRTIAWADLQSAPAVDKPAAPLSSDLVRVTFKADDVRAVLQKRASGGGWYDVCLTPCAGNVSPSGLYRVAGDGLRASDPFQLGGARKSLQIEASVGTKNQTTLGVIFAVGGGIVALSGLTFLLMPTSATVQTADGGERTLTSDELSGLHTVGGVTFALGAGAGIAGLVMLLSNRTEVTTTSPKTAPGRLQARLAGPFSVPLTSGLTLTAQGIVF